jgi:hypothetical protein
MPETLSLPSVDTGAPLAHLLKTWRTVRDYAAAPVELATLAALLWAGQGIRTRDGLRMAPSAGALYPREEQLLDAFLLVQLARTDTPGKIRFADPDAVIAVETIGSWAGLSLWKREDRARYPSCA